MDFSEFHDVAIGLLDGLADRLTNEQQDILRSMAWAGEEGLMIDMLAWELVEHSVSLTREEAAQVAGLLRVFDLAEVDRTRCPALHDRERVIASLHVVDES